MDAGCTGHAARLIRDVRLGRVNGLNRTDHSATTAAKTTRIRLGLQRQRRNFPVRALTGNRGNHRVRGIQPLFKQSSGKVGNSSEISGIRTAICDRRKNRMLCDDRSGADHGEPGGTQSIAQFQ